MDDPFDGQNIIARIRLQIAQWRKVKHGGRAGRDLVDKVAQDDQVGSRVLRYSTGGADKIRRGFASGYKPESLPTAVERNTSSGFNTSTSAFQPGAESSDHWRRGPDAHTPSGRNRCWCLQRHRLLSSASTSCQFAGSLSAALRRAPWWGCRRPGRRNSPKEVCSIIVFLI